MPTPDHIDNGAWRLLHQGDCPECMTGTIRYLENDAGTKLLVTCVILAGAQRWDVYKREICRGCGFESTELLDDEPGGAA